jgi:hypothetical protein
MKKLTQYIEKFGKNNLLIADGFDDAVIGIDWNFRIIYSVELAIRILMNRDKMSRFDAIEFLEFNTFCAYVGDQTPLWMMDTDERIETDLDVNQLFDASDELINFGNSKEISFGRGIESALKTLNFERTPVENANDDDDSITYIEQK